jgi:hypothetical protein
MDSAHAISEQILGDIWQDTYRCGLTDAFPMRPGRGRKASHPKGRRREGRRGEERFEAIIHSVESGLRSGLLSSEEARRQVRDADMETFIRVTETREEVVEALAYFFSLGYHLWEIDEEPDDSRADLFRARFATRQQLT